MKVPEVDSSLNDYTICGLYCGMKTKSGKGCKRYIVGIFYNPYFESKVMPGVSCDLRNQEWHCFQHLNSTEYGE